MAKSIKNERNSEIIIAPARGSAVDVAELAKQWAYDQNTIRGFIREGMPVYKLGGKGVAHVLSTRDCLDWYAKREADGQLTRYAKNNGLNGHAKPDENDRLKEIKIETAEIALAERRGDLFHMADWVPLIEETALAARQRFQNVPMDFQTEFSDTPRIGQMVRWLNGSINKAMRSLSDGLFNVPQQAEDQK